LRFARHLPDIGWNARVVSLDTNSYERYDPELLRLVPASTEIVRVRQRDLWQSFQAQRARRVRDALSGAPLEVVAQRRRVEQGRVRSRIREAVRRIEASCYHPDPAMGWIRPAVKATVEMARRERPGVIWATAGPMSSFVVAERAFRQIGVPYVLDFRDASTITYNEFDAGRPPWARRADRRRLARLFAGAQAVTFRYQTEAECYWRAYPGTLEASRIHIIPNGYDGGIDESPIPARGERCTVLYTGTLSSYRYDTLLLALRLLKDSDEARARQLRLLVVGEGADALAADAARLDVADMVEAAGPTSHRESLRLQQEAHALLVLGRPPSMKGHELFAGAKLFGYLRAGRPIVGVLPADETKRILARVGVTTIADGDAPGNIVAVFQRLLAAWSEGVLHSLVPDATACDAYSAERQTAALACALEGRPAAEPFVPGSVQLPASVAADVLAMQREHASSGYPEARPSAFLRP
jgi:hypothetical protein